MPHPKNASPIQWEEELLIYSDRKLREVRKIQILSAFPPLCVCQNLSFTRAKLS
jgi:hypothetical protein